LVVHFNFFARRPPFWVVWGGPWGGHMSHGQTTAHFQHHIEAIFEYHGLYVSMVPASLTMQR